MSAALIDFEDHGYGVEITFPNGKSVFMQGDDAAELVKEIDECETEEQEQLILEQYSVLVEDDE